MDRRCAIKAREKTRQYYNYFSEEECLEENYNSSTSDLNETAFYQEENLIFFENIDKKLMSFQSQDKCFTKKETIYQNKGPKSFSETRNFLLRNRVHWLQGKNKGKKKNKGVASIKTQIPGNIPSFYAQKIKLIDSLENPINNFYIETKIDETLRERIWNSFIGIYMDPPLLCRDKKKEMSIEQFEKTQIHKILKKGFLFIWVQKETMEDVVDVVCNKWNLKYVENICWVKKRNDNKFVVDEGRFLCTSKQTLLIFRKEGEIELKHQRNPDCVFDFVQKDYNCLIQKKPEYIYEIIETLLPESRCQEKHNMLLELWAKKNYRRNGWTQVYDSELPKKRNTKRIRFKFKLQTK